MQQLQLLLLRTTIVPHPRTNTVRLTIVIMPLSGPAAVKDVIHPVRIIMITRHLPDPRAMATRVVPTTTTIIRHPLDVLPATLTLVPVMVPLATTTTQPMRAPTTIHLLMDAPLVTTTIQLMHDPLVTTISRLPVTTQLIHHPIMVTTLDPVANPSTNPRKAHTRE